VGLVPGGTALAVSNPVDNDGRTSGWQHRDGCAERSPRSGSGDARSDPGRSAQCDGMSPTIVVSVDINIAMNVDIPTDVAVDISVPINVAVDILITANARARHVAVHVRSPSGPHAGPACPPLSFDRQGGKNEQEGNDNCVFHDQFLSS